MLALQATTFDVSWSLEFTIGSDTDTWTASGLDAVDALDDLTTWLGHPSRAWSPTTWAWSLVADPNTGGALVTLTGSVAFEITAATSDNPLALEVMGGPATSTQGAWAAAGTWAPIGGIAVKRRYAPGWTSDATGSGAVTTACPGTRHRKPSVSAVVTPLEAGRLAAVMATCPPGPRQGQIKDHLGNWITMQIGPVDRSAAGYSFYRVTLDVVEER